MQLDFSIVVPFFNSGQFIERCVQGLLSQNYPADRYEILMVDNNSTDQSASIVKRFNRVRLLNETQQGSYAARNRGVREAMGEIVAFTDPDCVPQPDWLEQIRCAMADAQTCVTLGNRKFATDSGILGMLAAYESDLAARVFEDRLVDRYFAHTNNMAVRMSILKTLGGFETLQRGADSLFVRRAVTLFGSCATRYSHQVIVRHFEIADIRDYLQKKIIYGRLSRNRELSTPCAVPLRTRIALALGVSERCGFSVGGTVGFLGVLVVGALRFEWERRQTGGH